MRPLNAPKKTPSFKISVKVWLKVPGFTKRALRVGYAWKAAMSLSKAECIMVIRLRSNLGRLSVTNPVRVGLRTALKASSYLHLVGITCFRFRVCLHDAPYWRNLLPLPDCPYTWAVLKGRGHRGANRKTWRMVSNILRRSSWGGYIIYWKCWCSSSLKSNNSSHHTISYNKVISNNFYETWYRFC